MKGDRVESLALSFMLHYTILIQKAPRSGAYTLNNRLDHSASVNVVFVLRVDELVPHVWETAPLDDRVFSRPSMRV